MIDLYKVDNRGNIRHFHAWIDDFELDIVLESGVLDGQYVVTRVPVEENSSGRSIEDQLELTLNSREKVKLDSGFKRSIEEAKKMKGTAVNGLPLPMLAHKVNYGKIDWVTAMVQRKYDGHRCVIANVDGSLVAYSRKGLVLTTIDHVVDKLQGKLEKGCFLDGELYLHGASLQRIGSLAKRKQPDTLKLKFMCYDMILNEPFLYRLSQIRSLNIESDVISIAETLTVKDKGQVKEYFRQFREEGYEGGIVRHGKTGYEHKRSYGLMKVKEFLDSEFKVIDILPSKDKWARLVCVTKDGKEFKASCHGKVPYKAFVYKNKEQFLGKTVKLKFSHWTDEGIPFHPVSLCWHEEL
jgi:DNA ligase-1